MPVSVAVYPRLGDLLRARNLTIAQLEQQIEQRFGIAVDRVVLERLADSTPVQQADLEVAGAAAGILGVGLNDLFEVALTPVADDEPRTLSSEQSRRLAELLDWQDERTLSSAEQVELDALVAEHGRQLREHFLRQIARQRGITVDQARGESDASLRQAVKWWREFEADPERYHQLAADVRRQRRRSRA